MAINLRSPRLRPLLSVGQPNALSRRCDATGFLKIGRAGDRGERADAQMQEAYSAVIEKVMSVGSEEREDEGMKE